MFNLYKNYVVHFRIDINEILCIESFVVGGVIGACLMDCMKQICCTACFHILLDLYIYIYIRIKSDARATCFHILLTYFT
jgi:hypothetical protein